MTGVGCRTNSWSRGKLFQRGCISYATGAEPGRSLSDRLGRRIAVRFTSWNCADLWMCRYCVLYTPWALWLRLRLRMAKPAVQHMSWEETLFWSRCPDRLPDY